MKASLIVIFFSVLGVIVTGQYTGTVAPVYQKSGQLYTLQTTTSSPIAPTSISLSPQTSVSVHHTVVRNKPAYPYPYTESAFQTDGSEDTSYYYTYEETSEENKKFTTTPIPTTSTPTIKSTVRSFWNSQKAQLDARRKESSQKRFPAYNRPTVRSESKPKVEFKVREKPKFGLANRNKESSTSATVSKSENNPQNVQTTTQKSVKNNINEANLAEEKGSGKDDSPKGLNKGTNQNQIVERVGEIPLQNKFSTQIQAPAVAQSTLVNRLGTSRQSKFDESTGNVQFIDNTGKLQQPALLSNFNPITTLGNSRNQQPLLNINTPEQFLANLNKQQLPLTNTNQQSTTNQQLINNLKGLLNSNQQLLQNTNQQPPSNNNQQSLLNAKALSMLLNSQPSNSNNINRPSASAFVSTSPALNTGARSAEPLINIDSPASSLLSRLGSLSLGDPDGGLVLGRDGGYGGGQGLTFNLGPVADPLSILLKLLSFIPRPLLDLHGRIFFGIELGKNAGLVSGGAIKPGLKPIG